MKIIAFSASSSRQSINKKLVTYAASLLPQAEVEILDLNDYSLPLFSTDIEQQIGQPEAAQAFIKKIQGSDGVMISFAEHNGSYSAAYKNLFDWCSRINPKVYQDKPMVLLATSPGPGGAARVLEMAIHSMPYFGGKVKGQLSLPSFNDNFDQQNDRLVHQEWIDKLTAELAGLMD